MAAPVDPSRDATSFVSGEALFGGSAPLSGPAEEDVLLGRRLSGTYLVDGVLGEGGMGRVYRATHTRIPQKLYAIKVLRPDLGRDPEQLARFQREAEAGASVSHPGVVGIYDIGRTEDGYSYMVCEHLRGLDLDEYLEKHGPLDTLSAVRITIQICDALVAAHAQSVVHRDLKPQNIFLLADPDGSIPAHPAVKVLDFGLSRFLDTSDAQLTKTGMIMGTPAFMTPEQANGHRGDHRVDIYGIGAILYSILTGHAPFEEETLQATVLAVMISEPKRPRSWNPAIPETLELLVQRALAKRPEDRYPSVAALKQALEVFELTFASEGARPSEQPAAERNSAQRGRSMLASDMYDVRTSRPSLVLSLLALVMTCIVVLATAVSGLELFTGRFAFTTTELVLVLLGAAGTFFVPAFLWISHFRKTVWNNSAKVLDWLTSLRDPILGGFIAYGVAPLALRLGDAFVSRFGFASVFSPTPGLSWPGFTWILPAVGGIAALLVHLRQRYSRGTSSLLRRYLLGAPLHLVTFVLGVTLLWVGVLWRRQDLNARLPPAPREATPVAASAAPKEGDAPPSPAAVVEAPKRAPDAELAKALLEGVDGLLPLSERYPEDPDVLEPLVHAFAARVPTFADAMFVTKKLLAVAPERAADEKLRAIVRKAATVPGDASKLAFEILGDGLGTPGADILFDLAVHVPKAKERAEALLATEKVQAAVSPALAIAMELRKVHLERPKNGCELLPPLLERAKALGDGRAAESLFALASPKPTPLCAPLAKETLALASGLAQKAKQRK